MTTAAVLSQIHITQVWRALGGPELRCSGRNKYRGVAWFRGGDGLTVSLDGSRGVWRDHRDGSGGGILDLVTHVRGGSRQDALRFLASFAGVSMSTNPLPAWQRRKLAEERRRIQRELPDARYWRSAAVEMGEDVLERLKQALWIPELQQPEIGEIAWWWRQVERWRRLDDEALLAEYRERRQHHPMLAAALVPAGRERERRLVRMILASIAAEVPYVA